MRTLQLLALSVIVCGSWAVADTIELKTGERLEGAFKQATAAGAVIEVAGQPITIPLEKVKAIYFGAIGTISPTIVAAPAKEALDAIKGLQSVVESGLTYRDYATRVLDAKVKVDRYLSSSPTDPPELRKNIGMSMRNYELAGQAWRMQDIQWITQITPDVIEGCPAAKKMIPDTEKVKLLQALVHLDTPLSRDELMNQLKVGGEYPHQVFWKCAIAQGAEAERLLTHR